MIRKYENLSEEDKKKAREKCLIELINSIVEGVVQFDDHMNKEPIQEHIDKAIKKADELRTPWFAGEIMLEDSWLRGKLEEQALAHAQEAVYPELDDIVIYLGDDH